MAYEILTANLPESEAVGIHAVIPMWELQGFFGPAFRELSEVIRLGGAQALGPPFVRYNSVSPGAVDLEAVLPCDRPVHPTGRVASLHLDAAEAAVVRYVGRYEEMQPAYDAIKEWMRHNGKNPSEAPREVYVTSPAEAKNPNEWVTLVEQPLV